MSRKVLSQKLLVKEQIPRLELINPDVSVVKSLEFMKRLSIVAISTITNLRGVFPPDAFDEKKLGDQKVYVLRGDDDIPGTGILIRWIKGAFELMDSHHLKKMIIMIQKDGTRLETYTLSFSYNHEAIQYDVLRQADGQDVILSQSKGLPEDIAKSVRQLIRSILVNTTILQPLPDDCGLSMKILVDEDATSVPEFFQPTLEELVFPAEAETLKLGKIASKFTTITVSSKSVMNGLYEEINQDEIVDVEAQEDLDDDEVLSSQNPPFKLPSLTSNSSQPSRSQLSGEKEPEHDSNATNLSEKLSTVSLKERNINCICECSDLLDETIECRLCSKFQHKACYKLLESQVTSHVCLNCHDPNEGMSCSVPELIDDPNRKESALYRQALLYCKNSLQVSCKRIMTHLKVPRRSAEKIMKQLEKEGCLEPAVNKGQVRIVKSDFQDTILSRHFSAPSSDSTYMEIQNSPTYAPSTAKRQLSQDIQLSSNTAKIQLSQEDIPEIASPEPKRCRSSKTSKKVSKW